MAARAHDMPKTVATSPLYGGEKAYRYGANVEGAEDARLEWSATLKPDWLSAEARHSG